MKIVGVERVDYKSKKTDKPVLGYRFHMTDDSKEAHGQVVESVFLTDRDAQRFISGFKTVAESIGVEVRPYYNKYGRAEDLDRLG